MRVTALFRRAPQARIAPAIQNNDLGRTGSWLAFTAACIAACALIFSAGAQNVAHGYSLGLASSEFRALVLAAASAGASLLVPFCWLAVFRGRGFGPRAAALSLAIGCLAYAGVCSLGFVAGSQDLAISERTITADAYADRRALAAAARAELATLATIKAPSRAVLERRRELAAILVPKAPETQAKPVQADAQSAALAFYVRAAGWRVTDEAVRIWLALGMVLFLEQAAALGLTVTAALYPSTRRNAPEGTRTAEASQATQVSAKPETPASERRAKPDDENRDDPPAPKPPRGKPGRPATVLPAQAIERLRAAGGKANGTVRGVGKLLGVRSKTTAHRILHQLADAGLITVAAGRHGVSIALA